MGDHCRVPRSPDAYKRLRAYLADLRRQKGITQVALADALGVPQSYVSKYESGERRIDLVELVRICRALDADPVAIVRELISTIESCGGDGFASTRGRHRNRR